MKIASTAIRPRPQQTRESGLKSQKTDSQQDPEDKVIWSDWSPETRMNVANGVGLSSAAAVGFGTAALLSSGGISLGDVIVSTATAIFSAAIVLPATYDAMGVAELAAEASRVVPT